MVERRRPIHSSAAALLAVTAGSCGVLTMPVPGAARAAEPNVRHITNTADDGTATSLRGAIAEANAAGGDWIFDLDSHVIYSISLACTNGNLDDNHGGDLDILTDGNVTLRGPAGSTPSGRAAVEVDCVGERAIDHHGTGTLTLDRIVLTGGNTADGADGASIGDDGESAAAGGGIRSTGARVIVVDSGIFGNRTGSGGDGTGAPFGGAGGDGGNGGVGGAIFARNASIIGSSVNVNSTGSGGRGGDTAGATSPAGRGGTGGVAAIAVQFELAIVDSRINGNHGGNGGDGGMAYGSASTGGNGGAGGPGAVDAPTLSVSRSQFDFSTAGNGGKGGGSSLGQAGNGGAGGQGGAIQSVTASIDRRRSTTTPPGSVAARASASRRGRSARPAPAAPSGCSAARVPRSGSRPSSTTPPRTARTSRYRAPRSSPRASSSTPSARR